MNRHEDLEVKAATVAAATAAAAAVRSRPAAAALAAADDGHVGNATGNRLGRRVL